MKVDIMREAYHVENQLDQPFCYQISVSDAVSIRYRRKGHELDLKPLKKVILSPQSLIDGKCENNALPLLREPYGLQTREVYPFTMTKPGVDDEIVLRYDDTKPKFTVKSMVEYWDPTTFKSILEENFGNPEKRNPMIGAMKMGSYIHWNSFAPYSHRAIVRDYPGLLRELKKEPLHAMVIVGIDTDEGNNNCVVKNSYGYGWGKDGFGQVNISDLHSIEEIEIPDNNDYLSNLAERLKN
uniref:cysteine proteinase 3-like n=1 Tax=Erigeron canadensis TaxID=72917 RepID=UPI001CB9BB82|nr:cysteine proteinase 3-like [Erigeron canadensis]